MTVSNTHPNRDQRRTARGGFTLVELLVVIGIIALLIGILLPTLSRARQAARTVACLSNVRQLAQAAIGYASDAKGTLPMGQVILGAGGRPPSASGDVEYHRFDTKLSQYMGVGEGYVANGMYASAGSFSADSHYSEVMMCPEAPAEFSFNRVQYAPNAAAMPERDWEAFNAGGATGDVSITRKPAGLSQLYGSETVLFNDTKLFQFNNLETGPSYIPNPAWNGVDFAFWLTRVGNPWAFYRGNNPDSDADPSVTTDPFYGSDFPVLIIGPGQYPGQIEFNQDTAASADGGFFLQNSGPRFRHNGDSVMNAAFGDGSARGMKVNPNEDHPAGFGFVTSELHRRNIRIKFPSLLPGPTSWRNWGT